VVLATLGVFVASPVLPGCAGRSTGSDGGTGSSAAGGAGRRAAIGGTGGAGGTAVRGGSGQGETGGSAGRSGSGGYAGRGGSGGASGSGATSGAGGAASGGSAGERSCEDAEIGSFCVLGNPTSSGDQLVEGMPLRLRLEPSGCHSSSCTKVDSSWCSYLAAGNAYWVSAGLCLRQEGDVCTEDCGGGTAQCDTGATLAAGANTVSIPGTALTVSFTVPSVAMGDELCARVVEP
jgi:hypothetical protein